MAIDWDSVAKKAKKKDKEKFGVSVKTTFTNDDIAPVRTITTSKDDDILPVKTTMKDNDKRKFFQESEYFADGKWDKGDLTKTILGSVTDLGEKLGTGAIGSGEKLLDFGMMLGTAMNEQNLNQAAQNELIFNAVTGKETKGVLDNYNAFQKQAEKETAEFVAKDLYDESAIAKEIISAPIKERTGIDAETASIFAEKSDELAIATGEMVTTKLVGTILGGPAGSLMTGATSGGSEIEEALKQGATFDEAVASGMITAGASMGSGALFNGVKFGGETLTEGAIQKVASAVSSKTLQTLTKWGINTVGEGVEEVIEDAMASVGKKLTYLDEKEFNEIFNSETAWESFLGGIVLGGMFEGVDVGVNKIKGTDYVSGSTESEQNTLNKLVEERVSEATKQQAIENAVNKAIQERETAQGGKFTDENKKAVRETIMAQIESGEIDISSEKLGKKDVAKIEKEIKASLEDGKIDLSKIEEILTPDETKKINELKESLDNTEGEQKKAEIEAEIKKLEISRLENLETQAKKNKYLKKAVDEKIASEQKYQDNSDVTDEYEKSVIESAKRNANNTTETRKYVEVVRKLAKDRQTRYIFTNNQELSEQGDLVARDDVTPEEQAKIKSLESQLSKADAKDKAKIQAQLLALKYYDTGGLVRKNENGVETVLINVDSIQSKYSVVGHETKHTLEKHALNEKFNELLFEYAKTKGDLDTVRKRIESIYKNQENVDIDGEVAAELTGKYLFEDEKFLDALMKNKSDSKVRQAIDKIKELIDDLVIRFKGTEQEKQLREVQKKFTELYNSVDADIVGETTEGTQYALHKNGKRLAKKGKSTYNEVNTIAMQWANNPGTQQGDNKSIFDGNGNSWAIAIADKNADGGYRLIYSGANNEVADYERIYRKENDSFDRYDETYQSYEGRYTDALWEPQIREGGGRNSEFAEGKQGTIERNFGTTNDEYVRSDTNETSSLNESKAGSNGSASSIGENKKYSLSDSKSLSENTNYSNSLQAIRYKGGIIPFKEDAAKKPKTSIRFEDFVNRESPVWNNVDYNDDATKAKIMRAIHKSMVDEGSIVVISDDVKNNVEKAFPDLRSMKKEERKPILKEAMLKLKSDIRNFLNGFKNQSFEFEVNGKVLDAKLYSTGINEVLEKITKEKAEVLYSTEDIFRNSRYLYSTPDYDGDPNIYRWNYFYTPVQIGGQVVGVRIAVRDLAKQGESQIYNWGIKKDTSLDGVRDDSLNRKSHDVSSDASTDIIPDIEQIVNDDVAKILTKEPKNKEKSVLWSKVKTNFIDKASPFETLALKTGNREVDAKFNSIRYSDTKAQMLIGEGAGGVKSLNDIKTEAEKNGLTESLYDYLYHKHNVDRMNLESREAPNLERLTKEIENLGLGELNENQLYAISKEYITKKTDEKRANLIKTVREYLKSKGVKNKPVFGSSMTAEMSQKIVDKYEFENPKLIEHANDVYNYNKYLRNLLVEGGVISQETADLWEEMYPHYVPVRRVDSRGLNINVPLDSGRTGINTPVKRAKGGNTDILPLFETMAQRTLQTYKAVAKNSFGIELKNTLGTTVESTETNLDEVIDSIDTQDNLLQEGKDGRNPTFTVFENGEKVTFEITDEMYDAMKPTSKGLAYTNKVLNKGTNIFRGLVTEFNPAFMLTNPIKDAQDVLINSQHPVRTYKNFPKAIKELSTKGKWYTEYIKNGGADNTYFDKQTNTFNKEKSKLSKVIGIPLEKISDANNFIERIPRLAEYIASREMGRSVDVSMLDAARVTTNFAAGGDVTKFLNRNGATFLNASVQGAVQQVRNVREAKANGLKGWVQLATKVALAGLPAVFLNGLLWDDDEEYEELSDYVKQNYYVVAKTQNGKFVRIPKGRTMAVIQEAFTQVQNALTGDDEVDLQSFLDLAISNLAPNNPIDNNIIAPIKQVIDNKTWYGEDLVPVRLQDVPDAEQYDESTDAISKWMGEKLNYSPYKINYLLNQYSGGVGDMFLPMLTPEAESGNNSLWGNFTAPIKDKFSTDSIFNNQNTTDFYNVSDELTVNANSINATDEDVLKNKYFNSISTEIGELYKAKREIQNSNLSDELKYKQVRDIQKQINGITENALNTYENVNINGKYANIGDRHYRLNDDGEWQKITDEQLAKQNEVTSGLGITPSEYWSNKTEYDYAYTKPEKYAVSKAIGGYDAYKAYSSELYDIEADKDSNGNYISGSKKKKVIEYINGLDIEFGAKCILLKSQYPKEDSYNKDIVDYLLGRDDITMEEKKTILKELGATIDDEGYIHW